MVSTSRTPHCLPPEDIAALVDGRLSGAEHARVVAHIADCADCYAVLAGTVDFLDHEEGARSADEELPPTESIRPVKAPNPGSGKARDWGWMFRLAASVLVGVGVGWLVVGLRQMPSGSAEEWTPREVLPNEAPYSNATRSGNAEPGPGLSSTAFLSGVKVIDLHFLLSQGRMKDVKSFFEQLRNLEPQELAAEEQPLDVKGQVDLEQKLLDLYRAAGGSREHELGKWAEAGRLAAKAEDRTYFAEGSLSRRFLDWTLRNLNDPDTVFLPDEVPKKIEGISELVQAEALSDENLRTLAERFVAIIEAYERSQDY